MIEPSPPAQSEGHVEGVGGPRLILSSEELKAVVLVNYDDVLWILLEHTCEELGKVTAERVRLDGEVALIQVRKANLERKIARAKKALEAANANPASPQTAPEAKQDA